MNKEYDFTIITKDGCPHCDTAKKGLKEQIDSGLINVMDVAKDKSAMDLATKLNITGVPSIIVKNKATQIGEVCELKQDFSGVVCDTKEVDF
ncbi:MAG: hypothetical protein GY870_12445 [archaeon]|nr:hypothetical protein [archaeon]